MATLFSVPPDVKTAVIKELTSLSYELIFICRYPKDTHLYHCIAQKIGGDEIVKWNYNSASFGLYEGNYWIKEPAALRMISDGIEVKEPENNEQIDDDKGRFVITELYQDGKWFAHGAYYIDDKGLELKVVCGFTNQFEIYVIDVEEENGDIRTQWEDSKIEEHEATLLRYIKDFFKG